MVVAPEFADPGRVYYRLGGQITSRPILKGADRVDTFDSVPQIDVSAVFSPSLEERTALAKKLYSACTSVGFFYAVNPPIDTAVMDGVFEAMADFFALPKEEKMKWHGSQSPATRGYIEAQEFKTPQQGTLAVDLREQIIMGDDPLDEEQKEYLHREVKEGDLPMNQWPGPPGTPFRDAAYAYYSATYKFAKALCRCFALALGLPEDGLDEVFRSPISGMNMIKYGAQEPGTSLAGHADFSMFTLVYQDQTGGLEALNDNAEWISVPPLKHSWTVNVGDYLSIISNGLFRSTIHRVTSPTGAPRMSVPLFFSPDPTSTVRPFPELIKDGEEPKFEPVQVGQRHVQRTLTLRHTHPTAVMVREAGIPMDKWGYWMMQGRLER